LKDNFSEIDPFSIIGNTGLLFPEKFKAGNPDWKPCYIYALSKSLIYQLDFEKLQAYTLKIVHAQKLHEKINFLVKTVPGMVQLF